MAKIVDTFNDFIGTMKSVIKASRPPAAKFKPRDLAFFFRFIRPVWIVGLISVVLVMITTGITALLPLTSKVFIDFVIQRTGYGSIENILRMLGLAAYAPRLIDSLGSIYFVVGCMVVAGIIYGILHVIEGYVTSVYQQELTFNVQTSLFDHVLRFPMSLIKNKQTGYLMSRVSDDVNMMQYLFSDAITQLLSSAFYVIFGVAILMSLNAGLAIVIALALPVYMVIRYIFSSRIRALSYLERESNAEVARSMQEALSGVEVVKSYAAERKEVDKISLKLRDVVRTRVIRSMMMTLAGSFMRGCMFVLLIIFMIVGARDIQSGAMTIGDYVTFISYIVFLSNAVNTLYYTYLSLQPAFASMDRLKEMFSIVPEFEWDLKVPLKRLERMAGQVVFDDVSFAYNVNEPILKNISFEVKPGETVALVGHSGAGKTTLVSLLLKLYMPQSGTIYLDGVDLCELDHAWLRQQISIVSQDIFLFNDSIENNIKYGKPEATKEDVVRVAKKARIHDFIEGLPNGYDTLIGERGTKLSVGQRQRISIARAFLKDTPIIILDEPTSAIDPETEMHLKESLDELMHGRTTFIISHRMSLTDIASFIVVIEGGRVVERGTQHELEQKEGVYNRLRTLDRTHEGHAGT
jgi:ABC-type multidrug transport system fused ATPase/permease subunit